MNTHYLVDYENVSRPGLDGFERLSNNDHIDIFFTKNNKKIDMDVFTKGKAAYKLHEVKEGAESADKHILAYLGIKCAREPKNIAFVVVSKDKGFDEVIKYLSKETNHKITRQEKISNKKVKEEKKKAENKPKKKVVKTTSKKATGEERNKVSRKIQKLLSKEKIDNKFVNETASVVAKHLGKQDYKTLIKNDLKTKLGDKLSNKVYKLIEKEI